MSTEHFDESQTELPNVADTPKEVTDTNPEHKELAALSPLIGYGIYRISNMPEVRETINDKVEDLKESFNDTLEKAKDVVSDTAQEARESIKEFGGKVTSGISDFCRGIYNDVNEFVNGEQKENPTSSQFPETAKLNEGITEEREFGLDKCTDAALEIFNPGVINEWGSLSDEERKGIALEYADRVAEAFELKNYRGVYIEKMKPGVLGSNNGDGSIHLSDTLISGDTTPFSIMDTITHELRHQYQNECINNLHNVSDEVRKEWSMATAIYNYDRPSSYDPWGYSYNPLEIDSNYAGNTVVRNVSSRMFNDAINNVNA